MNALTLGHAPEYTRIGRRAAELLGAPGAEHTQQRQRPPSPGAHDAAAWRRSVTLRTGGASPYDRVRGRSRAARSSACSIGMAARSISNDAWAARRTEPLGVRSAHVLSASSCASAPPRKSTWWTPWAARWPLSSQYCCTLTQRHRWSAHAAVQLKRPARSERSASHDSRCAIRLTSSEVNTVLGWAESSRSSHPRSRWDERSGTSGSSQRMSGRTFHRKSKRSPVRAS